MPVNFPNVLIPFPCNTAVIEQSVVLRPNPNEVVFPSNFLSHLRLLNVICAGGKGS